VVQLKKVGVVLGAVAVAGTLFVSFATWAAASEAPGSPVAVTQIVPQVTPTATPAAPKATAPATPAAPAPAKAGTGGVMQQSDAGSTLPVVLGVAALAIVLAAGARMATRRR
jgi:hypothetical protein